MNLQDFDFSYPESLVALEPLSKRDSSKLLVSMAGQGIQHSQFCDVSSFIPEGSLLVLNNTKVFQARLKMRSKHGGKVELLFLEPDEKGFWSVLMRPSSRYKMHDVLVLSETEGITATFLDDPSSHTTRKVQVNLEKSLFYDWLEEHGETPLPPYIKKQIDNQQQEKLKYQTVYAKDRGSAAAPTAGLHFTPEVLSSLKEKSIEIAEVCLHVGAGTFLPVRTENVGEHSMHTEMYKISSQAMQQIRSAVASGRPVVAVGTTSFRAVESMLRAYKQSCDWDGLTDRWLKTDLFVYPKSQEDVYKSEYISAMITNFHQPKSTLFMLICSLVGYARAKDIYREAIEKSYRLFSYGDSSLLWF